MESTTKKNGRKRAAAAAGMLLVAGALVTSAAFTDFANINLNDGTSGSSIGPGEDDAFALWVAVPDAQGNPTMDAQGNVKQEDWINANNAVGVDYRLSNVEELAPGGGVASVTIPMKNNSAGTMLTKLSMKANQGSGTEMVSALRFTVKQGATTVASNVTLAQAQNLSLKVMPGKGTEKVTIDVSIADQGAAVNSLLATQEAFITARIDASSD